ncbi:MAG: DUF5916 domain-containing protein [Thermoanaerobaculia bacterium]
MKIKLIPVILLFILPSYAFFELNSTSLKKEIDGIVKEEEWADSLILKNFYEIMPGENSSPPVDTIAYLSYDEENFYIAFKCFDPNPEKIRARYADRDSAFADDLVGIFLDTFNDQRNAYEFIVNPFGAQMDCLRREPEEEDCSWDGIWYSKGRITKEGYEVEMAIPFKTLRYPKEKTKNFRFMLLRIYPRDFRVQISNVPIDRGKNCTLCQAETLENIQIETKQKKMEIIPTLVFSSSSSREDLGEDLKNEGDEKSAGLSLSYHLTSNFSLNGTVNPDFSQVEADVAQIDVNTRFALFYPEKRPFFLEGQQYFSSPLNLIYTRSMADPNYGFKLTGKEGKNSLGIFLVEDEVTNFLFPSNQSSEMQSLDMESKSSGFRYKRDLFTDSYFGIIYLGRKGKGYNNNLYGADGKIRLGENEFFYFQYVESSTSDPFLPEISDKFDGKEKDGHSLLLNFEHSSRNWYFSGSYLEKSPFFRADLGFIPRVDVKIYEAFLAYTIWNTEKKFYSRLSPRIYGNYTKDFSGKTTDWETFAELQFELIKQIHGELGFSRSMELYEGIEYKKNRYYLWANSRFSQNMTAFFSLSNGDGVDYENERAGKLLKIEAQSDYRFGKRIFLDFSGEHHNFNLKEGNLYKATYLYLKVLYHFSNSIFLRTILQSGDIKRNKDLYLYDVPEKDNFKAVQFLFTYKINPFTLLYLGFSTRGMEETPFNMQTMNRTYFLKLSYSFWI